MKITREMLEVYNKWKTARMIPYRISKVVDAVKDEIERATRLEF